MPEYYTNGNSILGPRPILAAPEQGRPNALIAAIVLLACAGLVAAMVVLKPGAGGSAGNLQGTVAYVLANFDDGSKVVGTGFVFAPDGSVLTPAEVLYPHGPKDPPARVQVLLNGQPFDATPGAKGVAWAVVKLRVDTKEMPYLHPEPAAPAPGTDVRIAGFDPNKQPTLITVNAKVKESGKDGLTFTEPPAKGLAGSPVVDPGSGRVVGMLIPKGEQCVGLPVAAIDVLKSTGAGK